MTIVISAVLILLTNAVTAYVATRISRAKQLKRTPSFAAGLMLGESEALNSHQKVLTAYQRLFPNAK